MTHRIRDDVLELGGGNVTGMMFNDIASRDAMPASARYVGMIATLKDGSHYNLESGLTNSDWRYLYNDGYGFQTNDFSDTFVADIILYVESAGDDSNDGRSVGTAFLTLQRAFDELPAIFSAEVRIVVGAGSFAGATLNASGPLSVEGSYTITTTLSSYVDGGFVAGTSNQKAFTAAGGGSLTEGTHFILVDDYPTYPAFREAYIPRTSPSAGNHIVVNRLALSSSPVYGATWDTTFTTGITRNMATSVGSLSVKYCHLSTAAGGWFVSGIEPYGCKITGANAFYLFSGTAFSYSYWESELFFRKESYVIPNLASNLFKNRVNIESCISGIGRFSSVSNTTASPKVKIGSVGTVNINQFGPCDFESAGTCIELIGNCHVNQDSQALTCLGTGSLAVIGENCTWEAKSGAVTGTVTANIELNDGTKMTGMSGFALTNTSTAGNDVQVGTGAAINAFADLPIANTNTFSRASV